MIKWIQSKELKLLEILKFYPQYVFNKYFKKDAFQTNTKLKSLTYKWYLQLICDNSTFDTTQTKNII